MTVIERCGFCGSYVKGGEYMTLEECKEADAQGELDGVPLGYCPNAQQEHYEQNNSYQNIV